MTTVSDPFGSGAFPKSLTMPGEDWVPLTAHDTDQFAATRGIYIGSISGGATLVGYFIGSRNKTPLQRTIPGLVAGVVYQMRLVRLMTASTVTSVFGIY